MELYIVIVEVMLVGVLIGICFGYIIATEQIMAQLRELKHLLKRESDEPRTSKKDQTDVKYTELT